MKRQVMQVRKEMEMKFEHVQRLKQQLQNQEHQLRDQRSTITTATKKIKILEQQMQKHVAEKIEATEIKLRAEFMKRVQLRDEQIGGLEQRLREEEEFHMTQQKMVEQLSRAIGEEKMSYEAREKKEKEIERRLQIYDSAFFPPEYHFMLFPYKELKATNSEWYSPPLYTHPGGYKFCINVTPNGYEDAKGSHMSLYLVVLPGEFDDQLQWPVTISYNIQLLHINGGTPVSYCREKVIIESKCNKSFSLHGGIKHFTLHEMESKYLKYDCLCF